MLLSEEERARFADYLEREAMSSDAIAEQMDKLGAGPMEQLARQERTIAAASRLIARRLRAVESQNVSR